MELIKIPIAELKEMDSKGFIELAPYIHKNPLVRWVFWKRLETALSFAEQKAKVLDFGAGSGIFMPTLSKNFKEAHCLDLNTNALHHVKKLFNLSNVKIVQGKAGKLPYKDEEFDIIFATDVLEHFPDSFEIQKEFQRVLKKQGLLIISGPTENFLYRMARKFMYKRAKPIDHYTDIHHVLEKTSKLFSIEKTKTLPLPIIPGFKIIKARKPGHTEKEAYDPQK